MLDRGVTLVLSVLIVELGRKINSEWLIFLLLLVVVSSIIWQSGEHNRKPPEVVR
jgi:hypothetical protein